MSTSNQVKAIVTKFNELRVELAISSNKDRLPSGAKPTVADLWNMAALLTIKDMER